MSINPDEDTEFNDALRKHGILPPRPKTPPTPPPPPSPTLSDLLDDFSPSELRELGEDAPDDEAERLINEYRDKRLEEERKEQKKARFGRVYPIGREDYTREVTEASEIDEELDENEEEDEADSKGKWKGTGVVCFLYKDGIPRSDLASRHIHTLAARYPRTKFVSIVGDKCIPDLPDTRIPMIIVYRKGEIRNQIIAWGADRERKLEELEVLLIMAGAITPSKRPITSDRDSSSRHEDTDDDESDDPSSRMRSAVTATNKRGKNNIRGKKADDSDSDFDFDL